MAKIKLPGCPPPHRQEVHLNLPLVRLYVMAQSFVYSGFFESSVPQLKANYHKNSAQAEFLCFCVFAGKNTVYLANQSCKDGESKALCHKNEALCHKKGLGVQGRFGTYKALTSQKPQAKATDRRYQRQKRIPRRKPANYRKKRSFLQFCAFAEKNAVSLTNQGCKGALAPKKL